MAIDLIAKFSAVEKVEVSDSKELFDLFLASDEEIILSFKHLRDKVLFTSYKIICYDVQGLTGSKKEYRFFPYSKISSFSVETAGFLDADSDFTIWISGVGCFEIKFGRRIDIKEIGSFISSKISH
jgi:Bacterial PH domain